MVVTSLGQTRDPRALIPGDPAALRTYAASLAGQGDSLLRVGDRLRDIDTAKSWSGPAADAFREKFAPHLAQWLAGGDSHHAAAAALSRYADTLSWAQTQAVCAIQEWDHAQVVTEAAVAEYNRANSQDAQQAVFVDPGAAGRENAAAMLVRIREQLASAGNAAAQAVTTAADSAPRQPMLPEDLGDDVPDLGEDILATVGPAALIVGGAVLTAASLAGVLGGGAVSATGVGAVGGLPLTAGSIAGIAAGTGMMAAGIANSGSGATGRSNTDGSAATPAPEPPPGLLTPPRRLEKVYERLNQQPRARNAEEAMEQLNRTLDQVEDEYSGVPRNPNPGLKFDGRMYPPREDFMERTADGGIIATTKGNEIHASPDGSLRILSRRTGEEVYNREGAGK